MSERRHIPGLDGVRALAVAGVLAYHAGVGWTGGGLLGVDVFFVLSGFLITTLLLGEHGRTGGVSLRRFWCRRARRLLPALFLALAGVAAYGHFLTGVDSLHQLRGDALATLGYFANWHYVLAGQSYFAHYGAPSPLLHTWSLAVEEQFYVLWPVLALLALRRGGRARLGLLAGSGVLASAGLTAGLFLSGAGVSRLYYGTDVRAQELMVGCLLAVALPALTRRVDGRSRAPRRAVLVAGLAGAGFLGWALHAVSGSGPFLYEGGFLAVACATAALVALVAVLPASVPARVLSLPPVRYVGRISYGLYLYHWPIFLALDHAHTGLAGLPLLAVRMGSTALVSVGSFHLIEEPIRSGRVLGGRPAWVAAPMTGLVAAGSLLAVTTAPAAASVATPSARMLLGPAPRSAAPPPGTPTVRALMVGDSLAWTFANGLQVGSRGWGVSVENLATLGCDLAPASTVMIMGQVTGAAQGCAHWQTKWPEVIAAQNPDVVGLLVGRWEVSDRLVDGRWVTVGDRSWDTRLSGLLNRAVDVLSAHGARVVLFTLPYIQQNTEQPDGRPWPQNLPSRTDAFNALVRKVAAAHPGVASVVDLNHMLSPGRYTDTVDGVVVRSSDREHISVQGGELVRSAVLPRMERLGVAHAVRRAAGAH
ncbi:MAG TPA: acyltransferase family protein [Acidimicrobiales bacterium]|nr:acyltransferase family protein [Acidimicrobiales bacterium]